MDLVTGAKKVIIAMEHTAKGNPKILKQCSYPLTARHQVDYIVTEMGFMKVTPDGVVLQEINPEFSVEEVQAATEAELIIPNDLKHMEVWAGPRGALHQRASLFFYDSGGAADNEGAGRKEDRYRRSRYDGVRYGPIFAAKGCKVVVLILENHILKNQGAW
ncbi:hypothetical protein MASR2M79_24990 [Aminivibrio sp.]